MPSYFDFEIELPEEEREVPQATNVKLVDLSELVPGLTDDPSEMEIVARFGASLGVVERAEILPFHQMGKYKWEKLGLEYGLSDTAPPSASATSRAIDIFASSGLNSV